MPELPEVETIVRQLRGALAGAVVESVQVARPDYVRSGRRTLRRQLPGRCLARLERVGKRLVFVFRPAAELVIHLGMSGRAQLEPRGSRPLRHTHVRVRFAKRVDELRICDPRRFGGVWFHAGANGGMAGLTPTGPDALSIRVPTLRRLCRRQRQIKALLLDQRVIAGLGNIYCDEALFAAGIHPTARASDMDDARIRRLACGIRKTLRAAIEAGGSTLRDYADATGAPGTFQKRHRVYGRSERPCLRCGTPIRTIQVASRTTHFCPRCQRLPQSP